MPDQEELFEPEIAALLAKDRESLASSASIPDAGCVWWKAQLRSRREAADTASRPITVAQLLAFGCAVGLLGACFGATSEWFQAALQRAHTLIPIVAAILNQHSAIVISIAAAAVFIPAALYLTVGRD